jgi:hypothetical protein
MGAVIWTDARDDALARAYERLRPGTPPAGLGEMWIAIWQELNTMPGGRIATPQAVRARYLDVVQDSAVTVCTAPPGAAPAGDAGFLDVSSLNSPPGQTTPAAFSGVHRIVSYDYAKAWAEKYGLSTKRMGLDLRTVNAVRKRAGAAPFVLQGSADG